ncbi:hypothetical protein CQW23_31093 [Capsicum baccatum]|uniref:Uncharacterized protein n=1 Tax=Capsicum baccatum TaxID=33114 RepID=A0A2G2V8H2_CAPBA|nr:hypothetical protein CQW23_31093 [Capsicum baccatum]
MVKDDDKAAGWRRLPALVETAGGARCFEKFSTTGSIHENVAGSLAGTVRGVAMGGTRSGISASANGILAGIAAGIDDVQQGGSYAGGHGGTLVDSTPGQTGSHTGQLYGRRGDAAVYDILASSSHAYRPCLTWKALKGCQTANSVLLLGHHTWEGSAGLPNTTHSDAYRPPPDFEGSTGLPNTAHSNAYRPPPHLEGSSQLPNAIPGYSAGQNSASAIYQVAGIVTASELYPSSGL